jgi:hypothetical protein
MNRHVKLTKRIRTPHGLRFYPVVVSANSRVKPDYVLVGDREERHQEGAYYLEWYDGRLVKQFKLAIKQAFTAIPLHLLICFLMAADKV